MPTSARIEGAARAPSPTATAATSPVQEQHLVASILRAFPEDVRRPPRGPAPSGTGVLPKIVDLADGTAVYDERQARKRPDWTYF